MALSTVYLVAFLAARMKGKSNLDLYCWLRVSKDWSSVVVMVCSPAEDCSVWDSGVRVLSLEILAQRSGWERRRVSFWSVVDWDTMVDIAWNNCWTFVMSSLLLFSSTKRSAIHLECS